MSPYVPDDFDEFWAELVEEARQVPLDFKRSLTNDFDLPGFTVETIRFRGTRFPLEGWLAFPDGQGRLPGFVWLAPYGRESLLPNQYGVREGFASLSFNFHGLGAFHQEKYVKERGYFAEGAASPGTWVFRSMVQDAMIAARVLQAQVEVDEDRIGAIGMSQGAGMAIWLGAFSAIVKAVCADMPFLGAMPSSLSRQAYRYPLKELVDFMDSIPIGREQVMYTLSYFDTVNVATRCKKPTQVSLGLKDPASRPEAVTAIYEALSGPKELIQYDWGHDWHPEMVDRNRGWLARFL